MFLENKFGLSDPLTNNFSFGLMEKCIHEAVVG